MKTNRYTLRLVAPDGETITEGKFASTLRAWDRYNAMGSRWVSYPIPVITSGEKRPVLRSLPHNMPRQWEGRTFKSLVRALKADPEMSLAYAEGKTPFLALP